MCRPKRSTNCELRCEVVVAVLLLFSRIIDFSLPRVRCYAEAKSVPVVEATRSVQGKWTAFLEFSGFFVAAVSGIHSQREKMRRDDDAGAAICPSSGLTGGQYDPFFGIA